MRMLISCHALPITQELAPLIVRAAADPPVNPHGHAIHRHGVSGITAGLGPFVDSLQSYGLSYGLTMEERPGVPPFKLPSHLLPTYAGVFPCLHC
jgi:hypothetical protein